VKLKIKMVPGSSRECIVGWLGEQLKVCVKAPPEKGKANKAVEKVVASALGITQEKVNVIQGKISSRKIISITGLTESEVLHKLEKVRQ